MQFVPYPQKKLNGFKTPHDDVSLSWCSSCYSENLEQARKIRQRRYLFGNMLEAPHSHFNLGHSLLPSQHDTGRVLFELKNTLTCQLPTSAHHFNFTFLNVWNSTVKCGFPIRPYAHRADSSSLGEVAGIRLVLACQECCFRKQDAVHFFRPQPHFSHNFVS